MSTRGKDETLSGIELEPQRARFDRLGAIHMKVQCGGAADRGFARNLYPGFADPKHEVVAPPLPARVEDRHFDASLGISKRQAHVLGPVAVAACQDKIVELLASTPSAWDQVLYLERAVEELLRSEAVLTLVVRATGDFLVRLRRHARDGVQR